MTNDRRFEACADAAKSELTGEQLDIASGGKHFEILRFEHSVKSPRDAASGLQAEAKMLRTLVALDAV